MLDIKQLKEVTKKNLEALLVSERVSIEFLITDAASHGNSEVKISIDPRVVDTIIKELKSTGFSVLRLDYEDPPGYKISWY